MGYTLTMKADEFVRRFDSIRRRRTMDEARAEYAEMVAARPPIGSWDEVPERAAVFVAWFGGNGGVYERRGNDLWVTAYGGRPCRILDPGMPKLGRYFATVWLLALRADAGPCMDCEEQLPFGCCVDPLR
jgi:hypothetical protein